jgi:CBS domain-containing protein
MLVGSVMSRDPVVIDGDHTVQAVARLLRERDVGAVVVVDEAGRAVGMLTDRDLAVRALAARPKDPGSLPVDRIMSSPVFTAHEDTLVFDLLREMAKRRIRRVPITDAEKRVIGVVSMDDLILLLVTEFANVAEVLGANSRALGPKSKDEGEEQ